MTVGALSSKVNYLENGVTLTFAVPFRFLSGALEASRVLADGTVVPLVQGVHFSTSGGGTDGGGTLTLVSSIAGAKLRIRRRTARMQSAQYTVSDRFPAKSHENALDRQMMVAQEQDDQIGDLTDRALMMPDGETAETIPGKQQRMHKYLAFDGDGQPISVGAVIDLVANAALGIIAGAADMGSPPVPLFSPAGTAKQWFGEAGQAIADVSHTMQPTIWRREPVAQAALRFPDYNAALTALGGSYLYPQGFDFDDDGNIYLNTATDGVGATATAIIAYDQDFNYLGYFFRPTVQSESIVVTGSRSSETLKFYFVVSSNLIEYAPGALPANGTTMSAAVTRINGGCGSIFSHNEGKWLIQQLTVDLGIAVSRTAFNFYDANFDSIGRFFVAKNLVGWQTSASPGYPHVPKMQGITHRDGKVYISVGGSYIPASEPSGPLRAADYGLIEVSLDGSVLQYGVSQADKVIGRVASLGYSIERTENEGVAVGPDGALYTLLVTKRPATSDANVTGLLLFREMAPKGDSWDDIASPYHPVDLSRYKGQVWPRSADNKMRDPISGTEIATMSGLLDLMIDMQLPDISYFSAVHNITPVSGLPTSENWRVDLFNLNNQTIHCRMTSTTSRIQQWFILSAGGGSWTATPLSSAQSACYLIDGVSPPGTRAGYASIYVDSADGDLKIKFGDGTVKTIAVDT
ncbi:hypothetical protein FIM10_01790 [Sphingomonadales bacterium 56]|uniref:hypothetical protein n=1 Tax=unclassified Sphingobium TaxID=2611147 RepID=UPI0019192B46|nr:MULTISPECIES: hypothetical protein [unclassified Sphingobium]MBY2927415.1 hypothetical protein [Sphingomonadales bacterium 56]MBY2957483.1 hypothetical protein [Sphingomonadales bacterium 58]MBY2957526.1 hypothetical protein [Sphingomonadales bacterium 58]CAD7335145.1 hypothetical protein SPHS8_00360 [Sphingobium sp. S8]CAD7335164.1 hypothetical protein SPHS6_00360 [Sphingobium sp. S6]